MRQPFARHIVRKRRNALGAQRTHAEIEWNAERIYPHRLRYEQRREHEPVPRIGAAAQKEHERNDERIHEYGEQPADDEFERRVFDELSRRESEQRRNERTQAAEPDVPRVARDDVGDQATRIQRGYRFRIEEGKHGQRLGGADLESERAESERAERPSEHNVQSGNDARPAQRLCGSFHYSVYLGCF